jgi:hypothetical protein
VLRLVWQASNVNKALQIHDARTHDAYLRVRKSLILAVRDVHPEYNEISGQLPLIYEYLKKFDTVISLNYDLIVYWVVMYGFGVRDRHVFKDCFLNGNFDENWSRFRRPISFIDGKVTLVFYPHGNLVLRRNALEQESKISAQEVGLLDSILNAWESGYFIPLFVSEGTASQKISSIQNSYYLSTVYKEVLPSPKTNLTIYGWGLGDHDVHILRKMLPANIKRVAISVFRNDQDYCNRASRIVRESIGSNIHIDFFDCESHGCWNH